MGQGKGHLIGCASSFADASGSGRTRFTELSSTHSRRTCRSGCNASCLNDDCFSSDGSCTRRAHRTAKKTAQTIARNRHRGESVRAGRLHAHSLFCCFFSEIGFFACPYLLMHYFYKVFPECARVQKSCCHCEQHWQNWDTRNHPPLCAQTATQQMESSTKHLSKTEVRQQTCDSVG